MRQTTLFERFDPHGPPPQTLVGDDIVTVGDAGAWAIFSKDGTFRYLLGRHWDDSKPTLVVGMLNPLRTRTLAAIVNKERSMHEKDGIAYEMPVKDEHIDDLRSRIGSLLDEIERWKDASGLECGGDPGGVTPEAAREYWENIECIANQRDDAVNSYLNCRQDLEYCKHHAHQAGAYICGLVEKELLSESSRMTAEKATEAMNNAAGAAMCVRRLRDSTPEGWPGGRICWTHTEEDSEHDLPRIEARPEHRTKPHFTVQMRKLAGEDLPSADVIMTHSEPDLDDLEYCIAEFSIAFRDDLPECSRCSGSMRCYGISGAYDCPWCGAQGVSVMDEAMKIAAWIYNSWLTTRSLTRDAELSSKYSSTARIQVPEMSPLEERRENKATGAPESAAIDFENTSPQGHHAGAK